MRSELARAKVNLCLHVTGRRADGLHLLDSIVVFPEIGDVLTASPAEDFQLRIDGPFGQGLSSGADNLITRAARLMSDNGAAITLEKNLPIASGIGGGSSDAAACVRLLAEMWGIPYPSISALAALGADIPVCMAQRPARMRGIGEVLSPLPELPEFWVVLVNAGEAVETGAVFGAMACRDNAEIAGIPESFTDTADFVKFLSAQRNDMEAAAIGICPLIGEVLDALAATGCALSRMSGSGGTCFGVFGKAELADEAADALTAAHPDWWVVAAKA